MPVPEHGNLEAIRCWLMAKFAWPPDADDERQGTRLTSEAARIAAIPQSDLISEVEAERDPYRKERLLRWSWRHEFIRLSDLGPWKTVGGLPFSACRHSIIDAADVVKRFPNQHADAPDQATYRRDVAKIGILARRSHIWAPIPLLSILVAERDHRGREDCDPLRFSTEDGCHRAIACALAGHTTIAAWVAS
jgi:hypothetical protein